MPAAATATSTSTSTSSTSSAAAAFSSSSSSGGGGRKRLAKFKPVSNTILDSLDLAVSDSGDEEDDYEDEEEREEEDEEHERASSSSSSSSSSPSSRRQQRQLPPQSSRALRGSLLATQTLRAQRKSTPEIAASRTRFPLTGTFAFESKDAAGRGGGDSSSSSASPSPLLLLSAREVISAVSPFVSEERLRRIRDVARARCFTVLPIVEGLFDRGNLGAVCRTASSNIFFPNLIFFSSRRKKKKLTFFSSFHEKPPSRQFQAEAMGVGAVWACDISSDRYRATRGRCSAGSEKWIDVQVFGKTAKSGRVAARRVELEAEVRGKREGAGAGGGGGGGAAAAAAPPSDDYDSAGTLACLAAAKAAGFRVVVAAAGPAAVRAEDFDWETSPTAFVVGNEARGVSEEARALCDAEIMVPMVGMVESLNVSVASACILQAALGRIRQKSGADFSSSSASPSASSNSEFEEEVEALTAAMLLRHKGQQGKVGALWQAPMMRAILERGGGVER